MLLSTALKEIANEQDIFIWTGTQLNGTMEPGTIGDVTNIRGQIGPQNTLSVYVKRGIARAMLTGKP